jgi:hypothetical protein
MSIANVLILWHQGLFDEYGLRKLCYLREVLEKSLKFPEFSAKGKKVGEKVATACYIQKYLDNEHLYAKRMCQMTAFSLSADHIFKVSANIGFWCRGKWIQLYDSLFVVMNEIGVVMSWRINKEPVFRESKIYCIT